MIERVLVAVVAKYVCGKSVVQGVLLAVVAKVANFICDYLVTDVGCSGFKVTILTFGDRRGVGCSGSKVCMWEISCTKGVASSGCKTCLFNK